METKTVYFAKPGTGNTSVALRIAKARAEELGIKTILVASTTGSTAVKAAKVLAGMRVIAVSHSAGHLEANTQEFTEENKRVAENKGVIVLTTTHVFGGISRAMRNQFKMYLLGETIANTLRFFGQGMKVAVEISIMAADAGLVRTDEDVISIAGTARGADTVILLTPVNSTRLFSLKIKEILCKPRF